MLVVQQQQTRTSASAGPAARLAPSAGGVSFQDAKSSLAGPGVWRLAIRRPRKCFLPFFLSHVSRSDPFQREPSAVGRDASFTRNALCSHKA